MSDRDDALRRRRVGRVVFALAVIGSVLVAGTLATADKKATAPKEKEPEADAACEAEVPPTNEPRTFRSPEPVIQEGVDYGAIVHTSCGDITIDLLEADAPVSVNNFVFLVQQGYYDGLQFFRVESNSVIEAGDPNNDLTEPPNGPGYTIEEELPRQPKEYVYGVVAMANEGTPNTTGSNFFIVIHENRPAGYQTAYSIFGRVSEESYEVLKEIGTQETRGGNEPIEAVRPIVPIYIESIEITQN